MIYADIIFWSNDIKDISVILPFAPRIGENIEFPIGAVRYNNSVELEERCFKISNIDWVFCENPITPKYEFQKLSIYVERL